MSSDPNAATRRIMNHFGTEPRTNIGNLPRSAVVLLFGLPVTGLLGASTLGLDWLGLPLALVGLIAGVAIIVAAPSHLPATTWLRDVARFYLRRPRRTLSRPADATHAATEGGLAQYAPFTPSERTQDLTSVERAWPGTGAVQRADRTMEAYLAVEPTNMGFAMSGDWERRQRAAEAFANTDLEFPLTVHTTTRSFPAAQLVSQLEDRLDDPDVTANPAFADLIEEYRARRPADLAETREHRYYLGVEVTPVDVYSAYDHEPTPGEKLAGIPLLGLVARPFVERREQRTAVERRAAMFEQLDERLRTVRTELVAEMPGWSATQLSTLEVVLLAAEFWNGAEYDRDHADRLLRTQPALRAARRGDT